NRQKRLKRKRRQRTATEILDDGATERRLAHAGFAGEERDAVAPADRPQQLCGHPLVGCAAIEELRIGRRTERRLVQVVERFVDRRIEPPWQHVTRRPDVRELRTGPGTDDRSRRAGCFEQHRRNEIERAARGAHGTERSAQWRWRRGRTRRLSGPRGRGAPGWEPPA